VRDELAAAIIAGNAPLFRQVLMSRCPDLAGDRRLYCVFIHDTRGMVPVVVTNEGVPLHSSSVIEGGTPICMLNGVVSSNQIRVKIGEEVWAAPWISKSSMPRSGVSSEGIN
jgi:hypothetical protein